VRRRPGFPLLLALVALGGLAIRLVYTLAYSRGVPVTGDALTFHVLGHQLAEGRGFVRPPIASLAEPLGTGPTAEHPPLFELLVGLIDRLGIDGMTAQKAALCLVGTLTVVLVGLCARRLAGDRAGLIAAALAAAYPFLWVADGSLMSETVYGALIAAIMLAGVAFSQSPGLRGALVLGGLCGLAALTRGEALLLAVLLLVPLALTRPLPGRRRALLAVAAVAAMLVVLAPWALRNALTFDEPVLISTNSAAVFAGANCADSWEGTFVGLWQLQCYGETPPGDESEKANEYRRRGLEYVRSHTGRLPLVMAVRVARAWDLFRPAQAVNYEYFEGRAHGASRLGLVAYYPLLLLAIAGAVLLRRRRAPLLPLLAMPLMVTITAAVVYGLTRFRFAAEPAIVVLAAVSLDALVARLRDERG
jgi:Dolichyl-phosphate-mannose-protein mannosyltransferase